MLTKQVTLTPATRTATPTSCEPVWNLVQGSNPGAYQNRLNSLAVVSANDIWAVGWYRGGSPEKALVLHWNGINWTQVPTPDPPSSGGTVSTYLFGVAAVATNDVWAVGRVTTYESSGASTDKALALHWNGVQWSIVPMPDLGPGHTVLAGVDAVSSNDVWAVGNRINPQGEAALILHWDGSQWTSLAGLNVGPGSSYLNDVAVISEDDIWTVGLRYDGGSHTLSLHYDGTSWAVVPSPDPGAQVNFLDAVDAVSSNDVWAVGYMWNHGDARYALALHWDGTTWSYVPDDQVHGYEFHGVEAVAHNDVWAVGEQGGQYGYQQPLIQHWDGTYWTAVSAASYGLYRNHLYDIEAVSPEDIWAVGEYSGVEINDAIIERYYSPCLPGGATSTPILQLTSTPSSTRTQTQTATRTSTHTSVSSPTSTNTSTSTNVVPSSTPSLKPSATATACRIAFADVPAGSTFHPYIMCMACKGIISGYGCGQVPSEPCGPTNQPYFRPGTNVTRGQISKMVALAAQLEGPTGSQMFEDVKPSDTFFNPIQQLAKRGYIGGYPCGRVPMESCGEGNLPYFRPGMSTTRGQLAKIVSEAARIADAPGPQKFADVQDYSPFFVWINRLANRGVIGGYPCGGTSEACDDQARAYFRPNENVKRVQTAK
ncbi:MAG: S-layer homology domain-containing protein, partial [Chloroflexota bacterium]|nr:S-layer homology domain-containing protein [Chloroflexota bacterium]